MADTRVILQSGDEIAGYRIADVIGVGGMAVVYRARQVSLERLVALKVLNVSLSGDQVFRERFRREGLHAASLEHPNIVPVYDSGEDDGRLYIAMRLIEGGTLADRMRTGSLTPSDSLRLLTPIAEALDVAHEAGLVHRDIKPQNILVGRDDHPYLTDFGVARGGENDGLTNTGSFIGSVNYASPEQIRGERLTAASDIYSLTAVAFQCLTGQVPYPRETDAGVMHAHLSEPPPHVPEDHLSSAAAVQEIVAQGMAKRPEDRFTSAGSVVDGLRTALETLPDGHHGSPAAFGGIVRVPPGVVGRRPDTSPGQEPAQVVESPAPPSDEPEAHSETVVEDLRTVPAAAQPPSTGVPRGATAPRRASRRRLPGGVLIGLAVAIAVALPLLALAARGGGADAASSLQSGPLALSYSSPWINDPGQAAALTELGLRGSQALSTTGTASDVVTLRAGEVVRPNRLPGGLPPALAATFAGKPTVEAVEVNGVPMVRFSGPSRNGGFTRTYVVAMPKGQAAIVCQGASARVARVRCDEVASTARLRGAQSVLPEPDAKLAAAVAAATGPVAAAARRTSITGKLKARATAARELAGVDRSAAKALRGIKAPARDAAAVTALAAALEDEATALSRLATAADKGARRRYQRSREAVVRAQRKISSALARLDASGYPIRTRRTS